MRVLELICTICGHVFSAPLTVYEIKKICEHDCYADLLCPRCLRRRCTAK